MKRKVIDTQLTDLSAYQIWWVEFTPVSGKVVTMHDQKELARCPFDLRKGAKYVREHFASKEKALNYIRTFSRRLDKKYMARLFTDKQFGMATMADDYAIPYTEKQRKEIYFVG